MWGHLGARILHHSGGISNRSFVPSTRNWRGSACTDIGPGNTVMDQLVQRNFPSLRFDPDGAMAAQGTVLPALPDQLLANPFFSRPGPKTTGPETFNLAWLDPAAARSGHAKARPEDPLAPTSRGAEIGSGPCR